MDSTQLATLQTCPLKYKYKYVEGLRKIREGETEHDLKWGAALHLSLASHYQGKNLLQCQSAFLQAYPTQLDPSDLAKTRENGVKVLNEYVQKYEEVDQQFKTLGVEIQDEFKLQDGTPYLVKIDWIVESQAGIWVVDHKSTGKKLDGQYWAQFEPNSQLTGYTRYAELKYGSCAGVIVNGISVGYRQRAYKGEPAGFHCVFDRQVFNRSPQQIVEWEKNVLNWLELEKKFKSSGKYPANETQCRFCEFRELCMASGSEEIKGVIYETCDPLEYLRNAV